MWRFKPNNKGWECPKCGHVYSPSTVMCLYCGNDMEKEYTDVTTPIKGVPTINDASTLYGPCKMPPQGGTFPKGGPIEGAGYKGVKHRDK